MGARARGPDQRDRGRQITEHELRVQPHDAIAKPTQLTIAALISATAACVIAAVNLNDQPNARSEEVHDGATRERNFRPKLHAELTSFERGPKPSLRLGEARVMLTSLLLEPSLRFRIER